MTTATRTRSSRANTQKNSISIDGTVVFQADKLCTAESGVVDHLSPIEMLVRLTVVNQSGFTEPAGNILVRGHGRTLWKQMHPLTTGDRIHIRGQLFVAGPGFGNPVHIIADNICVLARSTPDVQTSP